ncbi:cytochrome c1 [Sphingomonas sp.]|uniref:cytochrome c1 n=1 Tax=Sphingomonas sp. TaxID=28214 RepID=UPI00286B0B19|nr:cytochrome c1 [Sphingomonas sp.]
MIRLIARIVGIGFVGVLLLSLYGTVSDYVAAPPEPTAEHEFHREAKELDLESNGPLGKFDRAQLQRGLQVYTEVCAGCHSLNRVAFADLAGIGYKEGQIKAYAGSGNFWKIEVPSINPDTGEASTRKAIPSDRFPSPYANDTAARAANNNAIPPDLSLMTKARENGAAYVYSLLTGYEAQPAELLKEFPTAKTPTGLYYNPYFANLNIAMPAPLTSEGQVSYGEGAPKATVDQMAKDVTAFLVWTAEPKLENRHRSGLVVVIFLMIATLLGYLSYQNIWAEAKRKVAPKGPLDPDNKAKRNRAKAKAGIAG